MALGGITLTGCGLLLCDDPGWGVAGGVALATSALAGELAWERLWWVVGPPTAA